MEAGKDFTIQADRSAVTNIATETIAITAYFDTGEVGKPIHCVRIAHTTSGTAGLETLGSQIVPKGKLIGLIVSVPNGFADGNIDTSIQRVKLLENGEVVAELNDLADAITLGELDYVTPSPFADLTRPYRAFDFRPNGFDAKAKTLTLQIDVQDVSDSVVFFYQSLRLLKKMFTHCVSCEQPFMTGKILPEKLVQTTLLVLAV